MKMRTLLILLVVSTSVQAGQIYTWKATGTDTMTEFTDVGSGKDIPVGNGTLFVSYPDATADFVFWITAGPGYFGAPVDYQISRGTTLDSITFNELADPFHGTGNASVTILAPAGTLTSDSLPSDLNAFARYGQGSFSYDLAYPYEFPFYTGEATGILGSASVPEPRSIFLMLIPIALMILMGKISRSSSEHISQ